MRGTDARTEVKRHWEKEFLRLGRNKIGAHSDPSTVELENWFITKHLRKLNPRTAIEVGCGNGVRTRLFSRYVIRMMLGVDYASSAIRLARGLETKKLRFEEWDLETPPRWHTSFDCVVACRVLINLPSTEAQVRAVRTLASLLRKNGHLILCECSEQGHVGLNMLRSDFGLHPIKTVWHNVNIDEPVFLRAVRRYFRIEEVSRFGLYYLLTRVLHPLLAAPKEPDPHSTLNKLAVSMEVNLHNEARGLDAYGRHLSLLATRR